MLVGDDPASHIYVSKKHDACAEAGIESRDHRFPAATPESEVLENMLDELNADDGVDGILVQLPLPEHMDESRVTLAVDATKDVDGFHPLNAGRLFLGEPVLVPATPLGIMALLAEYEVELKGKEAVVVGRSEIVGKPIAMLLLAQHATVTSVTHERKTWPTHARGGRQRGRGREARPLLETWSSRARSSSTRGEPNGERARGRCRPGRGRIAGFLTPVPGSVGPMTIAMLLRDTLTAAQHRRSGVALPGS